jgi:hypothetical protein
MRKRSTIMNALSRGWRLWRRASSRHPEVFLHDPAGAMPHDLDDPFHDAEVQAKVGKILAGNRGKR